MSVLFCKHTPVTISKETEERLARLGESGRAAAEVGHRAAAAEAIGVDCPCPRCFGGGSVYVSTAGERRASNHAWTEQDPGVRVFSLYGGGKSIGLDASYWQLQNCDACRGGGFVFRATRYDARNAYRRVRAKACRATGTKRRDFDASVSRIVLFVKATSRGRKLHAECPGDWVRAAIEVALDLGVQP